MLTVACVFKSFAGTAFGHAYDASWVQKLAAGVARSLTVPHRFVCLTNMGEIEGVETIPLRNDWAGWWSKIELFRPGLFDGPVLSFDLDVLFTGNIDHMAGPFPSMVMLHDVVPGIRNSTCMWWDARNPLYGIIYDTFAGDPDGCMHRHAVWNQQSMGDQGMIADLMRAGDHPILLWQDLFGAHRYVHFSAFSQLNPAMQDVVATPDPFSFLNTLKEPTNPMITKDRPMVYCLGAPKFPLFPHLSVVRDHWR